MQGFGTALMGNTQLLGYFIDRNEAQAALIQGIGVVSNYAVLFQVWPLLPLQLLQAFDVICAVLLSNPAFELLT